MAKVKSLESLEKSKAKKEAEDLRFKNTTAKQKKFLKENPNARTMDEMEKAIKARKSAEQSQSRMNLRKGGKAKNTRRMNRLEELGRVDAEKAYTTKGKRNLKAEKRRIVRSLNSRGAAKRGHGAEIK
jgi:hypothetical protein